MVPQITPDQGVFDRHVSVTISAISDVDEV